MVAEAVTIIGVFVLSATSIGGWVYTLRKNGRTEGKMMQQVESVIDAVAKLPCRADPEFLQSMGGIARSVKNLEGWLTRVETEQSATNKRIDNIVDSRARKVK